MGPFRVLEFFSTTQNHRIFLFSKALPDTYIGLNSCILVNYTRKPPKVAVSMSSKKVFWVCFGFSNFFRLLETTEFFFVLKLFQTIISVRTYLFLIITQENPRKMQYQCPQKKLFGSVSGSRIFFDYSKRPNFSLF